MLRGVRCSMQAGNTGSKHACTRDPLSCEASWVCSASTLAAVFSSPGLAKGWVPRAMASRSLVLPPGVPYIFFYGGVTFKHECSIFGCGALGDAGGVQQLGGQGWAGCQAAWHAWRSP